MADIAVEFDGVWKKFKRGERHDSLRDTIPALIKQVLRPRRGGSDLEQNEFWALQDVSFQVKRGDALGIIGPNGAGKSTALKILSGILRPTRGRLGVTGRLSALIEVGAGFHADLTGRENVYLNGAILGMSRREIAAKFDQIVEFAGIPEFIDTPIKRYSSGMQARLGFAVAAHMDPDVLLVDEVLSVGDAAFRERCTRFMEDLVRRKTTLVFVSHNLDQVRQICRDTLVMDHGSAVFLGPTGPALDRFAQLLRTRRSAAGPVAGCSTPVVQRVLFRNRHGELVHTLDSGEPVTIEIECALPGRVHELGVSVNCQRMAAGHFLNFSTIRDDHPLGSVEGDVTVRLGVSSLPLADGEYEWSVTIVDRSAGRVLQQTAFDYVLRVQAPPGLAGAVHLPHDWQVDVSRAEAASSPGSVSR